MTMAPVMVSIGLDEARALFAAHMTAPQFQQMVMERLRDAGAPIMCDCKLRPAFGVVYRLREDAAHPKTDFTYAWLPVMLSDLADA